LGVPWTTRRSNQSILKEISPGISLEGMMLKLKLQYFGHLMRRVDSLEKTLMLGGIGGRRRIALISCTSKVMLKILQARLQQYVNCELPDVQAGFRKGRGTRDQIASIRWIMEKAREFQKNIYFCFIDYAKAFDCVDHNGLWKILQEMGIPDHLTCLLKNLYAGQEATLELDMEQQTGSK